MCFVACDCTEGKVFLLKQKQVSKLWKFLYKKDIVCPMMQSIITSDNVTYDSSVAVYK